MKPQHAWLDALESDRRVPDYALQVAAVVARYADNPDDTWVTFRRLRHHTHQHNDKLSKSLGWLRDNGWLKVTNEGRGKRTHYRLTIPVGVEGAPTVRSTSEVESAPDGRSTPNGRTTTPIVRSTSAPDARTTCAPDDRSTNVPEIEGKRGSARSARAGSRSRAEEIIQTRTGCTDDEATAIVAAIKDARPDIRSVAAVVSRFGGDELHPHLEAVRARRAAQADLERRKANAVCKTCDDRRLVTMSSGCSDPCPDCAPRPQRDHAEDDDTLPF